MRVEVIARTGAHTALCVDLLEHAIESARHQSRHTLAGLERAMERASGRKRASMRAEYRRLCQAQRDRAWIAGAPAVVPFDVACDAVGVDPDALRSRLSKEGWLREAA